MGDLFVEGAGVPAFAITWPISLVAVSVKAFHAPSPGNTQ